MDPVQTQSATPAPPMSPPGGFWGTKIPSSAAFLVGILLFLLPFAEVKCNGTPLASNTGIGIATGSEWKEEISKDVFGSTHGNPFSNRDADSEKERQNQDPNIYAIVALALGIIGFIIALLVTKKGAGINLATGVLAAASLIGLLLDLRSKMKSENSIKSSDLDLSAGMIVTVGGTVAFYFAVILFVLGALFSWVRSQAK